MSGMDPAIGIAVGLDSAHGQPLASLRQTLDRIAGIGFTHAELSAKSLAVTIGGHLHPRRLAALQEALAGCPLRLTLHGTGVSTARAGNLVDVTTVAQRRVSDGDLALAVAIGAEILVHHSGMLRTEYGDDDALTAGLAAERDALRALGDDAARHGVTIAVENIDPVGRYIARRGYGLRLDHLAEQVQAIDHPAVKICLDLGHAYLAGRYLDLDYLAAVRDVASLVAHLHLSDNLGRIQLDATADLYESIALGDGDLHLPPGWGVIPLSDVFQIPFPLRPRVILELRPHFTEHFAEALVATRQLLALQPSSLTPAAT